MIPYGKQNLSEADKKAVLQVLESDWLTQGPKVPEFEQSVIEYLGGGVHALAVTNGTSALHLAYAALGVMPGDKVWVTTMTFVASANAARYCGADVDFLDINPRTYNIDIDALEDKLSRTAPELLPKVICAVDFAGQSANLKALKHLSHQYGFKIIEDACHAFGGQYLGQKIGCCEYADIVIFSFHPVKSMTTAEGGMLIMRDKALSERAALMRSHGITRDPELLSQQNPNPWHYEQQTLGFNYRMTDLQAALGTSQLTKLDDFVCLRQQKAKRYDLGLEELPLVRPYQDPDSDSAYHIYPVLVAENSPLSRDDLFEVCRSAGIGVNVHYIPVHTQAYYQALGSKLGDCPVAEAYYKQTLTLPLFPTLTDEEQDFVISTLTKALLR